MKVMEGHERDDLDNPMHDAVRDSADRTRGDCASR
jgi:hypothetical protein